LEPCDRTALSDVRIEASELLELDALQRRRIEVAVILRSAGGPDLDDTAIASLRSIDNLLQATFPSSEYYDQGIDERVNPGRDQFKFITVSMDPHVAEAFFSARPWSEKKTSYTKVRAIGQTPTPTDVTVLVCPVDSFPSQIIGQVVFDPGYPLGTEPPGVPCSFIVPNIRRVKISAQSYREAASRVCVESINFTLNDQGLRIQRVGVPIVTRNSTRGGEPGVKVKHIGRGRLGAADW